MFYVKPIISLSLDNHRFIGTGHDIQKSDYISSWPSCVMLLLFTSFLWPFLGFAQIFMIYNIVYFRVGLAELDFFNSTNNAVFKAMLFLSTRIPIPRIVGKFSC
jgi:hypothetical protein